MEKSQTFFSIRLNYVFFVIESSPEKHNSIVISAPQIQYKSCVCAASGWKIEPNGEGEKDREAAVLVAFPLISKKKDQWKR